MARRMARAMDPEAQRRQKRLYLGAGCLTLVAILLVTFLVIHAKMTGGPYLPPDVSRRVEAERKAGAAPGQPGAAAPVARPDDIPAGTLPLPQQLQQLEQASRTGDSRPQTLYISEVELNEMLRGLQGGDLRNAQAYFGKGAAYVTGEAHWQGREFNITATAAPVVVNGGVQFVVEDVRIGSLSAPESVVQRVQSEVAKNQGRLTPAKTGLYVEAVAIRPGVAILTGRPVAKQ